MQQPSRLNRLLGLSGNNENLHLTICSTDSVEPIRMQKLSEQITTSLTHKSEAGSP